MKQYGVTEASQFDDDAEALALSFANTADWHASDVPEELLLGYGDLLTWGRLAGVLTEAQAEQLLQFAGREPGQAGRVLERAKRVREVIYRLFSAAARGHPLPSADLKRLNETLPETLAHLRLAATPDGVSWTWSDDPDSLDQVIWPAVYSAAELLASEKVNQVGQCDDDRGCGWLYLDNSRNHSRRWCSMERCGNRAKARRHYQRASGKR